ncbi:MAG: ATP-binding protein, partial [Anaerolineales bacterium]
MSDYRFYLFGTPRLEYQNESVAIDTRKALALLAYLFIEVQPQSRDTLAALLWPDSNQTSARAALRRTLSPLRNALDEDLVEFGREKLVVHPEAGLWCDVMAFRERLAACQTHGHGNNEVCPRCLDLLQEAADLYTADFMAGFSLRDSVAFDDWQFFEADRLRRELAGVLERLVAIHQEQGDFPPAIDAARRWLSLDPLNEAAHRALIYLYAKNGQRNAALRQYRECVRFLDEELGVAPLPETTHLYETAKENHIEMPMRGALVVETDRPHVMKKEEAPRITSPTPLIGRASEWEQLIRIYEGLRQNGVLAALIGEPGSGKTHLAQEFIAVLQNRGAVTLAGRGYAGESNLAYTPIIDLLRQGLVLNKGQNWWQGLHPRWLSEIALLLPELSAVIPEITPAQPVDGPGALTRFYEGICQTLTALVRGPMPGLIFIDNLEWVDESTLDLLAYLARRLHGRPLMLMVAWQGSMPMFEQALNDAERQGYGLPLLLNPLSAEQSLELIETLENPAQPFSSNFKQQLAEVSQGYPSFLVEYLQAALEGEIRADMANSHWPLPAGLRAMLHARLANLSGPANQILQAAAVIGRAFESDLLQMASGRNEDEIIQGIEELLMRNLIREVPVQAGLSRAIARYDFKQEQVRTLVLEEISLVRQRLLHRRVAEALVEQTHASTLRTQSGQIAYHFQQAGLGEQAAQYYFEAGQSARDLFANADALANFESALALGYPQKTATLMEIGDLHALNGDYPLAIQQYEAAAAFSTPDLLSSIEQKIGRVYLRRGFWEQAACHFEAALYDLEALPPDRREAFEAEVRADWSLSCHSEGKTEQAYS